MIKNVNKFQYMLHNIIITDLIVPGIWKLEISFDGTLLNVICTSRTFSVVRYDQSIIVK